jgi:hypothetical protein
MLSNYESAVPGVFGFIREDLQAIRALAVMADTSQSWQKPDDVWNDVFSDEIRSCSTLGELRAMYKRLKAGVDVPTIVFHTILLKMLWIASGRASLAETA